MAGNVRVVLKSVFDDKGIKQAQAEFGKVGKTIGAAAGIATAAFAAAGVALARFGVEAARGAEQAAIAQRRLDNIAKSMNIFGTAAGRVSKRLGEFAEANELIVGVDADVIKATQAKLLTFKELAATADVVGGAMDRATMAALDLAAAGFGSAETNAIQLGKALNDPIKGITALRRAGVTFTKAEQDKIKALVEGNRLLEAQDLILSAIETQVGGTAQATASAFERITLATNQVKDAIGEALLPVVEDFADQLVVLVPELQNALAPAAQEVATIVADNLLPAIEALGEFLKTPEGIQAVKDLTQAFVDAIAGLADFTKKVWENREAIAQTATIVALFVGAYTAIKVALGLATTAQLLFNVAAKANPYLLAATAIVTAGMALTAFAEEQKEAREAATGLTGRLAELVAEQNRLKELVDAGVISYADYQKAIGPVNAELATLQGAMMKAAGAGRDLNNVSIGSLTNQLSAAAGEANRFRNILAGISPTTKTTVTTTVTSGPKTDPAAEAKKRFEAVQKVIEEHQKKLARVEKDYLAEVFKLNKESEKNIKALREKALADQLALVNQSKRRLTDAFKSATQTALTSLFDSRTVRELTQSVRRVSAALTITTSQETERIISGSVGDVIDGLRKKILGARNLINNASALAGLGFSQTFIEQIVEGGTETGNELAKAILEASPETQAELKRLFLDLEDVSENGMKGVADKIFQEQGLATQELKELYKGVSTELNNALIAEQERLASALVGAGLAFNLAVLEIKDEFLKALEQFDGAFAGLGKTIDAFLKKLDVTAAKGTADVQAALTGPGGVLEGAAVTQNVAFKDLAPIKTVSGLVVDSMQDVAGTIAYLQERINAANRFAKNINDPRQAASALATSERFSDELANLRGLAATGQAAGTTININVKTDTTQSQAMVGRTIGNIVTKYVTTGGQVLVSGNA